jgi:hypothetical protein
MASMTTMVMREHKQPTCGRKSCESFISTVMLAKPMKNLDHADYAAGRLPYRSLNTMPIGRR